MALMHVHARLFFDTMARRARHCLQDVFVAGERKITDTHIARRSGDDSHHSLESKKGTMRHTFASDE